VIGRFAGTATTVGDPAAARRCTRWLTSSTAVCALALTRACAAAEASDCGPAAAASTQIALVASSDPLSR
jgi:hypothetical protein